MALGARPVRCARVQPSSILAPGAKCRMSRRSAIRRLIRSRSWSLIWCWAFMKRRRWREAVHECSRKVGTAQRPNLEARRRAISNCSARRSLRVQRVLAAGLFRRLHGQVAACAATDQAADTGIPGVCPARERFAVGDYLGNMNCAWTRICQLAPLSGFTTL